MVGPIVAVLALASWAWAWIGYRRRAPVRERLYQVWSRLFYCSRDGRVFDPETGMHTDLVDVVDVSCGDHADQRETLVVAHQVELGAGFAAISGSSPCSSPLLARIDWESTVARDQSSRARLPSSSRTA
ncbi:hypothetical protein HNR06_000019 [Nocardiopsis arvandica]|uniref:Uncharacterized protein n=1 Tax=Nocardiopsis sinuspersici TaxID=501010 RepID=A0A7Z0BHW9_9ACTN|nr:hypothetical protein [Nocardiopsis sinuspersici]NYH50430.1 hypothetical protein [Nocardiopsis sinuspersici]